MKQQYLALLAITVSIFTSCVNLNKSAAVPEVAQPANSTPLTTPTEPDTAAPEVARPARSLANSIPLATPIETEPNIVISPYKPYNKIDIEGYKAGQTVGDPSTVVVNPDTGKNTMKAFMIP